MKENKMKPKRVQRTTAPNWQGQSVNAGDKTTLGPSKPTSHVTSAQVKPKPFAGKVFYLDLPSNRAAETLESDIKELGGIVEKFFSKEIKYLITNKREAKYVQCLRQDSPVPSPDSGQSSPCPGSNLSRPRRHGDNVKSQADAFVTSRGKSLVERVVRERERVQMNKILSNALDWGVKVLYIDDVKAYVQKKKKIITSQFPAASTVKTSVKAESAAKQGFQKCKAGRISKPFIKVEDSSRHYRPIYLTMPNMPEFNLQIAPPCSPFCVEEKDLPGTKQKQGNSEERAQGRKKNKDKKRSGYCECCMVKYENLTMHLQSERHKAFSKSNKYLVVDRMVSTLPCNFFHMRTQPKIKRPKCSVSSVLMAPGPFGKTELRHKGDLISAETIKEEQPSVDGLEASYSGHNSNVGSACASPSKMHREVDRRLSVTQWDRSRHRSLARKRPCRQNSLTPCTQKPMQVQIPQPKLETAPSRGECLASIFPRDTPVCPVAQTITQDKDSSTSHHVSIKEQTEELSSKSVNGISNQQQESDQQGDSSVREAPQDQNILPTTNNSSESEEATSPVLKIQRRVRVYKRKRRKVDAHTEHVKSADGSMLTLLELFQSSDDTDVDFLGFEED